MQKTIDLLTIGDCSIDLFMKVDANSVDEETENGKLEICFSHGSKVPVDSFGTAIAGNACNVGVSAAKLGLKVGIYTELGDDPNADRIIEELNQLNIDTKYCIKNPNTPTNVHAIVVHQGERTIFSYHEPRDYKLYKWPTPKWMLYSSLAKGFDKFQAKLVEYINQNPHIGVAFNPGTQQLREGTDALRNMLEVTDVLFVNKTEGERLMDKEFTDLLELHKALQTLGPKLTVITLGDEGSTAYDGVTFEQMGVYSLEKPIADKTGAGDAYTTGFISALFYNKPLKEAMRWGTINAAGVIREIGATNGLKTKKELENTKF